MTIVNLENNDIILSQVIQRCSLNLNIHNKHTCTEGYHGTSKGMEKAFQWLSEHNVHISTVIHDKDSSTYAAASRAYPTIEEWLCVNHAKGNFYKDLVKLSKRYKYLEPWVSKATSHFSGCLESAHGDTTILKSN